MKLLKLVGQKFGRLEVLDYLGSSRWKCICNCGKITNKPTRALRSQFIKSCGCLQRESVVRKNFKHGFATRKKPRFYRIWNNIVCRCKYPCRLDYPRYGGRGIKCLWKSFEKFKDNMYESYQSHVKEFGEKQTQIDRINPNGNYCKENCRWVTIL